MTNVGDEDLKLIRQIVASDGRKYTAGNIDRSKYDRLVDMGWLNAVQGEHPRCRVSGHRKRPSGGHGNRAEGEGKDVTAAQIVGLLSAVSGAVGTLFLFFGSFAYEVVREERF